MTNRKWRIARGAVLVGSLGAMLAVTETSHGAPARHAKHVLVRAAAKELPHTARLTSWLGAHLPSGGSLERTEDGSPIVVHTVASKDETWRSIAERYLELTTIYEAGELAKAIVRANPRVANGGIRAGATLVIPDLVEEPPPAGEHARLAPLADGVLKGIYVRGDTAAKRTFPALLDRVVSHGMNAIVLDVKDFDGLVTYPSRIPLAIESGATKHAPLHDYARAVRFAHQRGVRVIARVSCFEDELMSKKHTRMSVRGRLGGPYGNGWLDPKNEEAQNYVLDLAKEAIGMGVDEVQLDYVRYPVTGVKNADFGLDKDNPHAKVEVITRFVERVHAVTRAHDVPLSLDVFGVIAFGRREDIDRLGQDPPELARHAEVLSAMVYPSHYDDGFMGYSSPGDHPELVGKGVKHMLETIEAGGARSGVRIRPWLQAMAHKSSNYGPGYIQEEIRTSDETGGAGWLLWNPGQIYDVSWRALRKPQKKSASRL